jgi:hypothetical protein
MACSNGMGCADDTGHIAAQQLNLGRYVFNLPCNVEGNVGREVTPRDFHQFNEARRSTSG